MKTLPFALIGALALAACSEKTQDSAEEMVESAAADTAANAEQVLSDGAEAAGNAADNLQAEVQETEAEAAANAGDTPPPPEVPDDYAAE
ncbi:hypothetical protein [Paraurantiacibacter namhicola]|uniref:Lipoprotein n=1 Tax=Paraurantiacibacter namhicola TaxID=645517 RepID=A0A1C7D8K0_9SPHN|nr:hypothetical protein [Paraurantiacibacter namhicola]ANU07682.1 hypothetical protein A6F65_01376 [Paraurantiacibacter namhicola]